MSFILDALKKAERERPPGAGPDLFVVHGPQALSARRPARAVVAGALLLVVPAIALWAWVGTERRDEGAAGPPVAAPSPPGVESPVAPPTPRVDTVPAPLAPPRPAAAAAAGRRGDERSPVPASRKMREAARPSVAPASDSAALSPAAVPIPAVPTPTVEPAPAAAMPTTPDTTVAAVASPPIQAESAVRFAPPPVPAPATVPVPVPVSVPMPESVPAPVPPDPMPGSVGAPTPAVSAPGEAPAPEGRVLDLAELPASVRAELPKLVVSGHVWSEEPSLRLLSIDDRLLHEGGEAAPGVSLREITPAGAVFVYKGWRFKVAGGRP